MNTSGDPRSDLHRLNGDTVSGGTSLSHERIETFTIRLREYVRVRGGGVARQLWGELTDEQRAAWIGSATELLNDLLRVDRGASAPVSTGESRAASARLDSEPKV